MIPDRFKSYHDERSRILCNKWFIDNRYRIDPNKRTIWFVSVFDLASRQFRVTDPLRAIEKYYPDKYNLVLCTDPMDANLNTADIIVMSRTDHRFIELMRRASTRNTRLVFDMDDSLYRNENHPSYQMWKDMGHDQIGETMARMSDCVIVTQTKLKEQMDTLNPNVFIIKNALDFDLPQWNLDQHWLKNKNDEGKIVIGWAGGNTHLDVLIGMRHFLKIIHDKYPQTHFILAGLPTSDHYVKIEQNKDTGEYEYLKAKIPEKDTFKNKVRNTYSDFDRERIYFASALPLSEYGKVFSMFNINIAYLHDNPFNQCKSENKIIEGLAYEAVPVYSPVGGYRDFHYLLPQHTESYPVISQNPEEWVEQISNVIENYDEAKQSAVEMKKHALIKYGMQRAADNRVAVFEELIKTL
jgi:hypothetical protein